MVAVSNSNGRATRRGVLAMAAGAAGAFVTSALGAAPRAEAADQPLLLGSETNAAAGPTGLAVTGTGVAYGLAVTDNGLGTVPSGDFPAILGHAREEAFATGVMGYVSADGSDCDAMRAVNDNNGSTAVLASHDGEGIAAFSDGAPAVTANSENDRGIISTSKLAQLQLTPGSQVTHPKAGEAGDLFVDKSARLWFCKVGGSPATWVKIA